MMSSISVKGGHAFICDACPEEWTPPPVGRGSASRDWHECWELAKAEGWRVFKVKSKTGKEDWENRCPECA